MKYYNCGGDVGQTLNGWASLLLYLVICHQPEIDQGVGWLQLQYFSSLLGHQLVGWPVLHLARPLPRPRDDVRPDHAGGHGSVERSHPNTGAASVTEMETLNQHPVRTAHWWHYSFLCSHKQSKSPIDPLSPAQCGLFITWFHHIVPLYAKPM